MRSNKSPSRRKRLIVRYLVLSVGPAAALAAAVLFLSRRSPETYKPGGTVEGVASDLLRALPNDRPELRFTNAAAEAGLDFRHFPAARTTQLPEDMGSGAAWGDYDGDGDWDLYLCDIAHALGAAAPVGGNRLYRNDGAGAFMDVTAASGVGFQGLGMAAAWADFDRDGLLDLVTTAFGPLTLYRNNGDGTFREVSHEAGLGGFEGFWTGASWADYDGDGHDDLYVCGYVRYDFRPDLAGRESNQYAQSIPFTLNPSSYEPVRNLLFHNRGDGTFEEVAVRAGVANPGGRSLSASWTDLDLDGRPDLYVANDVSDNALFRNRGDGTFEDLSYSARAADYRGAMGLAVGDFDNDGDSDLFVTHWIAQENGLLWNLLRAAEPRKAGAALEFTDVADMLGLGQVSLNDVGWGTSFADLDLDGRLDLFVANGSTFEDAADPKRLRPMRSRVFWQKDPSAGFFDVSAEAGPALQSDRVARGAAFADYDEDGDIDILVVHHQAAPWLLRNDSAPGQWLKVRVECGAGGFACFGATVEIETGALRQRREIGAQSSYLSQNAPEAHFGLGSAERVDVVRVRLPGGVERLFENVDANQTLSVRP
jgi:hypothetical protein